MRDAARLPLQLSAAIAGVSHYLYWPSLALLLGVTLVRADSCWLLPCWGCGLWQCSLLWRLQLDAALLRSLAVEMPTDVAWARLDAALLAVFGRSPAAGRGWPERQQGIARLLRHYLLATVASWVVPLLTLWLAS